MFIPNRKGSKMKKKSLPKPRNPVMEAALFRSGAGGHSKPYKVSRRNDKLNLKRGKFD